MPKVIKKKVIKQVKNDEQEIRNILHSSKDFVAEKKKVLVPIAAAAAIIVIVAAGFLIYRSNMNKKAEALEYEAYKIYYTAHQKLPLQLRTTEQYQKALELFRKAYDTKKSAISLYYIANCYYDIGKYDDTLATLKELNERFPDDERFVPLAYYKMAAASLKKADKATALKYLQIIYSYKTSSFKDLSIIESAKILDSLGKKDEADKKYEEMAKSFPNSPFAGELLARQQGEKKN